ncbi:MAG: hypothetical protein ABI432_13295 [Flavobacteriales bacterium]
MRLGVPLSIALLTVLISASPAVKQHDGALERKITVLMGQLDAYNGLSPFHEGDYEVIVPLQNTIMTGLLDVLNDPHITPDDLKKLSGAHGMGSTGSADGRVRSFSIDEKTGGTFRSNLSVMRYVLSDGQVVAERLGDTEDGDGLSASTFYEIHGLDNLDRRYLGLANVVTCGTCIAKFAVEFTLDSANVAMKTIEEFDGREFHSLAFEYEEATRSILYDDLEETSDTVGGVPMQRRFSGRWQDNGAEFVLVEACERLQPVVPGR